MTMQEKLQAVTQQIRKDIPRLMENTIGCVFENNFDSSFLEKVGTFITYDNKEVIALKDISNNEIFVDFDETLCINPYEDYCYTLIGHEPMLNDVMEWLKENQFFIEDCYVDADGYLGLFCAKNNKSKRFKVYWDLSKPYLKDQSEELIYILHDLIKKK